MRILSAIPAVAAFLVAAFAAVGAAALMVGRIEKTSEREIDTLFLEEQIDWVSVDVDGLQVHLTGTAPNEATRFRALTLAGTVVDATRVIDEMDVKEGKVVAPPDFSIEILRNDEGVSLIGLVPLALDREELTGILEGIAGSGEVADLLESADYPVPGGWAPALDFALDALAQLPRSKISVSPGEVEVTAISDSAEQRRKLMASLKSEQPDGIEVVLDISAPRPVITPFTLRFLLDESGGRFDACSADTEDGRARILAAAAEAGLQGTAGCTLGLGVPSPRWPDAVTEGISALSRLGGGSITFSDADVTFVAPENTPQSKFDRIVGELEAALPDVFSLHAVLPEPVKIDGSGAEAPDAAPEFVATLSPEGLLQLRGRMADERQRDAVNGFARARFSSAEVDAATRVVEGLPAGWAGRVFSGLEALSNLSNGVLVVQPDFIEIRGDTSDPDAKAEISRILSAHLGSAENFNIKVVYHEVVEEVETLPTPEECVAAIQAILAERKISFEPGSADIDSGTRGTIERIADVMKDCTAVPMEIAGYTDSQGRESMNLGLSQRRAEAVLEALMARRVLVANLTAKGYGEENPIADNDTEEGREANRRIEFTLRLREGDDDAAAEEVDGPEVAAEGESGEDEAAAEDEDSAGSGDGDDDAGEGETESSE
ncbi:OmpA family protein [Pseudoruegeria sp. HB172150]|uniref:OmpA family protein n=1 Tax=Pseudoruegeria sp. HB172150 TaxID=2721164 RepID=UPI001556B4A2|nr:OmpA family protein [Pseudoruegeria sp. HB172150]